VDVITGLIKANFPARISFRTTSKVDSRTILDSNGAEQLLGRGDMLFMPPGSSRLMRVHGSLVTEEEVTKVVTFLKAQGAPVYNERILEPPAEEQETEDATDGELDELYDDAVRIVLDMGKASTSALQRRLRIGYGRAASLLDGMQRAGIIGPPDGSKPRALLIKREDYFSE
jgi:S-DNA-T family DNA segregation ATPase FtsK/SpoIIIE